MYDKHCSNMHQVTCFKLKLLAKYQQVFTCNKYPVFGFFFDKINHMQRCFLNFVF